MKKIFLKLIIVATLFVSCNSKTQLTFKNPLNVIRTDEAIVLTKEQLSQKIKLEDGNLPVFKTTEDKLIPSQVDDLDGDGNWDEVVLVFDMEAGESKTVTIKQVAQSAYPVFEKRTNLRLGIKQDDGSFKEVDNYRALPCNDGFEIIAQAESVNWENDKIAFRVYFDCRNVKRSVWKTEA